MCLYASRPAPWGCPPTFSLPDYAKSAKWLLTLLTSQTHDIPVFIYTIHSMGLKYLWCNKLHLSVCNASLHNYYQFLMKRIAVMLSVAFDLHQEARYYITEILTIYLLAFKPCAYNKLMTSLSLKKLAELGDLRVVKMAWESFRGGA